MKSKNKRIIAAGLAAIVLLGASTLAWFTDRTASNINGLAGDICLNMSDIDADLDLLAPGDNREIKFTYENFGSLAVDTRITYGLTYDFHEDNIELLEEDIDIAILKVGDEKMVLNSSQYSVVKTFDGVTLNGSAEKGGVDKVDEVVNFYLNEQLNNAGQEMDFTLEVVIEGKQHRNNPKWEELSKMTILVTGQETDVVVKSACNVVPVDVSELFTYEHSDNVWRAEYEGYYVTGFHPDIKDKIIESDGAIPTTFLVNPVFPREYEGIEVVGIGSEAFANMDISSVSLSDTIKEIQEDAFYNSYIEQFDTGNVEIIRRDAFSLSKMKDLTIQPNIKELEMEAFSIDNSKVSWAESLKPEITMDRLEVSEGFTLESFNEAINDGIYTIITQRGSRQIDDFIIKEFSLPGSLKTTGHGRREAIGSSGRYDGSVSVIDNLILNEGITDIYEETFNDKYELTINNIDLPDSLINIHEYAFNDVGLKNVVIPDNVIYLGELAFGHNAFDYIKIGKSVKHYGGETFAPKEIGHVIDTLEFHDEITHLDEMMELETEEIALVGTSKIRNLHLPKNLKQIGLSYFMEVEFLNDLDLSNTQLEVIEEESFGMAKAKTVTLPDTLKYVGNGALHFDEADVIILPKNSDIEFNSPDIAADYIVIPDEIKSIENSRYGGSALSNYRIKGLYVNILDGDEWPSNLRGVDFSSYEDNITIKPLSEFK